MHDSTTQILLFTASSVSRVLSRAVLYRDASLRGCVVKGQI